MLFFLLSPGDPGDGAWPEAIITFLTLDSHLEFLSGFFSYFFEIFLPFFEKRLCGFFRPRDFGSILRLFSSLLRETYGFLRLFSKTLNSFFVFRVIVCVKKTFRILPSYVTLDLFFVFFDFFSTFPRDNASGVLPF